MALLVKNLPANAGDSGSIPGLGRSPGEGNGNPLQYSCLGSPMDRQACWATVHGVSKSCTRLKQLSNLAHTHTQHTHTHTPCEKVEAQGQRETFPPLETSPMEGRTESSENKVSLSGWWQERCLYWGVLQNAAGIFKSDEFVITRDIPGKKFNPPVNTSNLFLPPFTQFVLLIRKALCPLLLGIHFLHTLQGLSEAQLFPQSLPWPPPPALSPLSLNW